MNYPGIADVNRDVAHEASRRKIEADNLKPDEADKQDPDLQEELDWALTSPTIKSQITTNTKHSKEKIKHPYYK